MSLPSVVTVELDGALGILPASSGLPMAVVGSCQAGPKNTPAVFARVKDVTDTYVRGPAVEDACYAIKTYGKPVMLVRTDDDVAGSCGTVDNTGMTGTAMPSISVATADGDYEIVIKFLNAAILGTDNVTYRYSLDGGRTYSAVRNNLLALTLPVPESGVTFTLGTSTQTIVANNTTKVTTTAPSAGATNLGTALSALSDTALPWEFALISGRSESANIGAVGTWLSGMHAVGKHHWAMINAAFPDYSSSYNAGETAYITTITTLMGSVAQTSMVVCAGAADVVSAVSGRNYRSPVSRPVAALASSVSEEIDLAALNLGALPGVGIRDDNGNPAEHDEFIRPGLDDLRVLTLRTWQSFQGVYVTNPKMASAAGSDFIFLQHRRVMNVARIAINAFMARRLSVPLRVGADGFVLESELRAIETDANQMLRNLLLAKPKASSANLVLSRTDAILEPPFPLTGELRIQPLGYPKTITIDVGFTISAAARS